jgi:DUF1680 family protein
VVRLTPEQIEGMCRTDRKPNPTNEFGGISETLQDLADLTGRADYDDLARLFEREWFTQPLERREDCLTGLHANTHIPMALALARRYERTGETRLREAVEFFWERTAVARSYVNGGSSGPRPDGTEKSTGAEHWPEPFRLAKTLTPKINESCVTHNMLRLTDALFRWSGETKYAEFYQRAYFNHVLTMQNPQRPGEYLYDHPLSSGSHKKFGSRHDSFWCCYGSSVEAFERLGQGIYYHDDESLRVNLPVASELSWPAKGLRIAQETAFPLQASTRFTFHCSVPLHLTLFTSWAEPITRTWHDGETVQLPVPMPLRVETMPDDPRTFAFCCGPIVLAARTSRPLNMVEGSTTALRPIGGQPLHFHAHLADGTDVELLPLNQIVNEFFGVYFQSNPFA